jgi:hypothetical protein
MPSVSGSSSTSAPSTIATAGFTYVITVARAGPTSAMSAKNTMNAAAVHNTPSPTIDDPAARLTDEGMRNGANGR